MIKIVFFDIDGTLLHNKVVPDSAKYALQLLRERGIHTVLCTGRSEYEVAPLREQLEIDWAITCNGAHIGHKGRTIDGTSFPRHVVHDWIARARADERHTLLLYGAEKMYTSRSADCPYFLQARHEIGFLDPLTFDRPDEIPDIYQCILFAEQEDEGHYTSPFPEEIHPHRWRTWALDLNPKGINKSVGIEKLLQHLGLTREQAAAFGDGNNDIEMIKYVGRGIAMGNACPQLLACAPHVTRHVGDDGILHGVQNLILKTP